MLKIYIAFLVLIAGVTPIELCDEPFEQVCRNDNSPKGFPETAEEMEEFCTFAIDFSECGVKYANRCDNINVLLQTSKYLRVFQEICNEDTLLYAAVVSNLKCFSEFIREGAAEECHRLHISPSNETLQKYAEVLKKEGLLAVGDDENDTLNTMTCIHMLQELACYASKIEDKCGITAMDTYVEIAQKFIPVPVCGDTHYLPTVVRVYKLVEEEANEFEEVFKKRK